MMQFVDPRIFEGQLESLKVKVNYPLFLVRLCDVEKIKKQYVSEGFQGGF